MDTLERFPLVWCPTCNKTQKMIFVMSVGDNDDDDADIVCDHCKSIIATLRTPGTQKASGRRKRAAKARKIAGQAVDRLIDPSAPDEERHGRKRRLLKGPKEFHDIRDKRAPSSNADKGTGVQDSGKAAGGCGKMRQMMPQTTRLYLAPSRPFRHGQSRLPIEPQL